MYKNQTDDELRRHACGMWANWIETDNVSMSGLNADSAGEHVNGLSAIQMELVVRLRHLEEENL